MDEVVVAEVNGVGQVALGIGEIVVVPQDIDKLAAHVTIAEEEAVECIQLSRTSAFSPGAYGLAFV